MSHLYLLSTFIPFETCSSFKQYIQCRKPHVLSLINVNEQRNILHEIRKRKPNWIGHILRRSCLLQQVIEGKIKGQIEVTRRRWRRRKKLLDDFKDRTGYCQLKEEALDCTVWRNRFGRGFGPVVWQITDDDDDDKYLVRFSKEIIIIWESQTTLT